MKRNTPLQFLLTVTLLFLTGSITAQLKEAKKPYNKNYHGSVTKNGETQTKMSRVTIEYTADDKVSFITFSKMYKISLKPSYQIVMVDSTGYDLSKAGKGFLSGGLSFKTNLSGFPFSDEKKSSRLIQVEWTNNSNNSIKQITIDLADEKISLKNLKEVNVHLNNELYFYISLFIQIIIILSIVMLERQLRYYKAAFIFLVPKLTLLYMTVGDLLLIIQQSNFHENSFLPMLINLCTGIVAFQVIVRANQQYKGFSTNKTKMYLMILVIFGAISCIGFYGDNYVMEFCYSFFTLMVIYENSYVDIIQYNKLINNFYIPLKTFQVLLGIIMNDGWLADVSYWPLITAFLLPQIIKQVYLYYHRQKKPGFYKSLTKRELETYERRNAIQQEQRRILDEIKINEQVREKKLVTKGRATLDGDLLIQELQKSGGTNGEVEKCCICLDDVVGGDDGNTSGVVKTRCGHWFHKDCLEDWTQRHNNCPLCRAPLAK